MINTVKLLGTIRNIQYSHTIGDVDYDKAELLVPRSSGIEDLINIKFKKFSNTHIENDIVALSGNVRTFTEKLENDKNVVHHYVFTYFDAVDTPEEECYMNEVELQGTICKMSELKELKDDKQLVRFVLVNRIEKGGRVLTSYIHCVAFGLVAKSLTSTHKVGDCIIINGEFHSREYKKLLDNEGNFELKIANEIYVKSILGT